MIDRATPVPAVHGAGEYSNFEVPEWQGWTTLHYIKEQMEQMMVTHIENQISLARQIEDDDRRFKRLKDLADLRVQAAAEWQDALVGTLGNQFPIIGLVGTTLLGGMVGKSMGDRKKRQGDLDPVEVENEKAKAISLALQAAGSNSPIINPATQA